MEVLFFGGSFNPPHRGHRHVIETISKTYPNALLYVCPNYVSPFKVGERTFTPGEIWELCLAEFEGLLSEKVILWDEEIKQSNISYTIDSLEALKCLHPDAELSLVIGEDNLSSFDQWKSYLEILKATKQLIVVRRETSYPQEIQLPNFLPKSHVLILENPILPMSSKEIRKIANGDWEEPFVLPKTRELAIQFLKAKQGDVFL
ncbi:nicotinate-nicotinamide nucleotide adenylyltransferase [Leptospira vanthielii]|uniref:Probable nicotinate-nucleotide adenylyltransferase n=1 Tax=Leptospira vanthielii serovar Holland str. Waz Holland = ATCC 700522 TaxID=1218591 RepID=N1W8C5_9LEPT|nr:nicotinate-nicotinamide nucleotide adenylyltransferase [Leptospira vanthielii]EMY69700.1 putative nicotinate-nucleotide adenylyltransferase [Leptospira vanthielii serovar Holland str. Waz Holland = ATCC 700522]